MNEWTLRKSPPRPYLSNIDGVTDGESGRSSGSTFLKYREKRAKEHHEGPDPLQQQRQPTIGRVLVEQRLQILAGAEMDQWPEVTFHMESANHASAHVGPMFIGYWFPSPLIRTQRYVDSLFLFSIQW